MTTRDDTGAVGHGTLDAEVDTASAPAIAVAVRPLPPQVSTHAGAELHEHHHQLVWAPEGTLAMQTAQDDWVVAPSQALWVPAGTVHVGRVLRPGRIYLIYVRAAGCPLRWTTPTGLAVEPLMRELIAYLARDDLGQQRRRRAETLLFDVIEPAATTTIHVPLPRDSRARAVADALVDHPDDDRDLGAWGFEVGASIRTLARLFAAETGMTFSQWRTQVRMREALSLLADGLPVSTVARRVGYARSTTFITAFRRATGRTPGTASRAG